jgi:hypothetical protein
MELLANYLSGVTVGEPMVYQNLALFPLRHSGAREAGYLTLDQALAAGAARVTETSTSGSVPELQFTNKGSLPVLLLDGEELIGAKQNRVLNLTILAPGEKTIRIPVSCVEAGRWSQRTADFTAAPRTQFAEGRRKKLARVSESMARSGIAHSDQGEVWDDIAVKAARLHAASATSAMADIYEHHAGRVEDYAAAFTAAEGQVGALFALNGEVNGFDLFDAPSTLAALLPKLVRSYALDAIDAWSEGIKPPTAEVAPRLLLAAAAAVGQGFPAVGLGEDFRLTGKGFSGAALVLDGRIIHLTGFCMASAAEDSPGERPTRFSRASERRRRTAG